MSALSELLKSTEHLDKYKRKDTGQDHDGMQCKIWHIHTRKYRQKKRAMTLRQIIKATLRFPTSRNKVRIMLKRTDSLFSIKCSRATINAHGPHMAREYGMDIYLRQSWNDKRLNLSRFGINTTVALNGEDLMEKIWKPDLFFRNVKRAAFHRVTVPNMLVRIAPDGQVLYSMRLTLSLACVMVFRYYPLDTQKCNVILGAYAQTIDQTRISWQEHKPIVIESPIELPEFDLTGHTHGSFTRSVDTGTFSFLNVTLTLARQNGYHLIQTYLPTFLIVTISWVSFWLNIDATPARVTLGVTTLLTMTTVASGVRTQLPPVSYVKAIDVWIGACSVMVFGALLEFTLVNYLSRSKMRPEEFRKSMNPFACMVRENGEIQLTELPKNVSTYHFHRNRPTRQNSLATTGPRRSGESAVVSYNYSMLQ
ncbi:glycine receptor subunit alpha-3-like isoform X3 [Varroa jacobsoni]|uniref:glycine receptor subunit alpha-3-like isoform X3 n=1 Tax=Varroa jacobsoni TaxID=62625 RepID=UPI000BFA3503|nr:glycine receptor subunit alpha-3-like isoform X3 [Varroa jacobsoni]